MSELRRVGKSGLSSELAQQIGSTGYDPVAAAFSQPEGLWIGPPEGIAVEAAISPLTSSLRAAIRTWGGSQPRFTPIESHRNSSIWRADMQIRGHEYYLASFRWVGTLATEEIFGPARRNETRTQMWSTRDLCGPLGPNGDLYVAQILPTVGEVEHLLEALGQGIGMPRPDASDMAQMAANLIGGSQELPD